MTKIAFVFESFARAGSQRHLLEIIKGIKAFRPDVKCTLFLIAPVNYDRSTFLPEIRNAEIPLVEAPYNYSRHQGGSLPARALNWWSRRYRECSLNAIFYQQLGTFDTVVCAEPFVVDLLLQNLRRNQRFCFHLLEHKVQRQSRLVGKLLGNRRVHVIFQHRSQVEQAEIELKPGKAITWPLRISFDHMRELPAAEGMGQSFRIVHYSRISPMRLVHKIIDAFSLLCLRSEASLCIVGYIEDFGYHSRLLDQIERLGISGQVRFSSEVESLADDLASSDFNLVWMISICGHVGYAGIETMAAGRPTLLLEVDPCAHLSSPDPQLSSLICATPEELVARSLLVQADPSAFRREQAQLVRDRFITTKEAIDELTAFYLGRP